MELNRVEFQKQCAFQKFCKRVLHNEACNAHDEIRRRRKREVSFCDLALHEERQLYTFDKYFQEEEAEPRYQMAGKEITPKLLLEAIRTLPEEKRTAILLYYFEGMGDVEIGKMFNTSRSTIIWRNTLMNGTNSKQTDYTEIALVPYPVILAASKGDPDAMKMVLQHFSGYIASLSIESSTMSAATSTMALMKIFGNGCKQD